MLHRRHEASKASPSVVQDGAATQPAAALSSDFFLDGDDNDDI